MSTVMKSQSCLSYLPFEDSSHSHSSSNFRLRMSRLLTRFTLNSAWRMVAPLAEKMVSPVLSWMSMVLTPEAIRAGWVSGAAEARSAPVRAAARSEEHTSELQSRQYLVCRLLLEKKKN